MNGYLTATFDQLEMQRIPRSFIARTINNLEELGLLEVTHQCGHAGGARQNPSRYRLTFLNSSLRSVATEYLPATNDWVEVELALLDGRRQRRKRHRTPPLKRRLNGVKEETNLVIINETNGEAQSSSETSAKPEEIALLGPRRRLVRHQR
jgi:DNA-binding HxlR family transcriptional regulator